MFSHVIPQYCPCIDACHIDSKCKQGHPTIVSFQLCRELLDHFIHNIDATSLLVVEQNGLRFLFCPTVGYRLIVSCGDDKHIFVALVSFAAVGRPFLFFILLLYCCSTVALLLYFRPVPTISSKQTSSVCLYFERKLFSNI